MRIWEREAANWQKRLAEIPYLRYYLTKYLEVLWGWLFAHPPWAFSGLRVSSNLRFSVSKDDEIGVSPPVVREARHAAQAAHPVHGSRAL